MGEEKAEQTTNMMNPVSIPAVDTQQKQEYVGIHPPLLLI